jgi:hypothetical protein
VIKRFSGLKATLLRKKKFIWSQGITTESFLLSCKILKEHVSLRTRRSESLYKKSSKIYSTTPNMRQIIRNENPKTKVWKLHHDDTRAERNTVIQLLASLERCAPLLKTMNNPNFAILNLIGIL